MKIQTIKSKLPKGVKSIVILRSDTESALGASTDRIVVREKKKKKKQSKGLSRMLERLARRTFEANELGSRNYLQRHRRSNRKRRDGWLRDLSSNLMRSQRKGNKELKFSKLFKG
jgi:hypothetical protein